MSAERRRMRGRVAIVGAAEADEHGKLPHKSAFQLHAEAARNALADAGLAKDEVDAVFSAGLWMGSETAEYLGIRPRYIDGTQIGGCSFIPPHQHSNGGGPARTLGAAPLPPWGRGPPAPRAPGRPPRRPFPRPPPRPP